MSNKIAGHVLVVDDQENWRTALASLLSKEGLTVKTSASFEEAVTEITQDTFDLVVLDVRLVDKDVFNIQGLELLQMVKAKEPAPKVIILTGYPESIRDGVLENYGADALVLKVPPGSRFKSQAFREEVHKLLQQAQTR
jgi:CheY-like chemotaxis protein